MKTYIIVNPASSGGATEKTWVGLKEKLHAALGAFEWAFTEKRGHGTILARDALSKGFTRIIAVGGDGTINEVINGFYNGKSPVSPEAHLAVIDAGTGGDFRKNIDLPAEQDAQIDLIKEGHLRDISLGLASFEGFDGQQESRYFCVINSFGISGEVNRYVNENPQLKRYGSAVAFAYSALKTIFTYENTPLKVEVDGRLLYQGPVLVGAACNGPCTGGGMLMAPQADSFSSELDFVVAGDLNLFQRLMIFPRIYNGTHIKNKRVTVLKGKKLMVSSLGNEKFITDMDGDLVGNLPLEIEMIPTAIKVITA